MKQNLTPANFSQTIYRIFGDHDDAKRKAVDLKDFLEVGDPVRINCNSRTWTKAKVTRIGKRSFEVCRDTDEMNTAPIKFIIVKDGGIYESGTTNERNRYHWDVNFNCELIDKEEEHRQGVRSQSALARQLDFDIKKALHAIVPVDLSRSISDADFEKLKAIAAILGLDTDPTIPA